MSDIKAYTVDINLGVKAGLSFVTEQRSLLRFQFYSGYTKVRTIFTVLTLSVPAWLPIVVTELLQGSEDTKRDK